MEEIRGKDIPEEMYKLISSGLELAPHDHELYETLGDYYSKFNSDLAYLSYENALYLSSVSGREGVDADIQSITNKMSAISERDDFNVRNVSFVILSYNTLDYTRVTIESIRNRCFKDCYEIVVVDNHSDDGSVEWLREQDDVILIENENNVGFPAGCNQGIKAADPNNDILLLNSDTKLLFNSLYMLRMGLYADPAHGASGAVTNYAGNHQVLKYEWTTLDDFDILAEKNNIPGTDLLEYKKMLVMFAMLIRRDVVDEVGLLDERFSPGYCEDDDYGYRIRQCGYRCVLCWNSFILHFGSRSFGKDPDLYYKLMREHKQMFFDKWGFEPGIDVSLIVPCYNAERFVDRCVESLIHQSIGIDRLQLIFVDDASEDGTFEKLRKYEEQYPEHIILISNETHMCPGGARNRGLEYATGEYVGYCDIDDYAEADMFKLLFEQTAKYSYDIVYGKYVRDEGPINTAERLDAEYHLEPRGGLHWSKDEITEYGHNGYFGRMCWAGIYRRSFLIDNDIFFPEELIHEDIYWMELVQLHASDIYIVDQVVYHYEINPDSVTRARNDMRILDRMPIEVMLFEEYMKRGALEVYRPQITVDFIHRFYINTLNMLFTRFDRCPNVYDSMHEVIKEFFPDWTDYIPVESQDEKVRFLLTLLMKKDTLSDQELLAFQKAYLEL
ncbi:MAG: glycosyltransferase [Lachnospiraceae bacterium]|nr:glycosyltransferase [Lachnospiraceae bacterium]